MYAASIVLCYAIKVAPLPDKSDYFRLTEMAIEVLEAMDECFVAKRAGDVLRQTLSDAKQTAAALQLSSFQQQQSPQNVSHQSDDAASFSMENVLDSQFQFSATDAMFAFDGPIDGIPIDESQFMFWTDMSNGTGEFGSWQGSA